MTKTARKTAAKETIVDTITQRMANVANVIRQGDWTYTDTLAFHR
jgi:IS30 family transposase